MLKRKIVWVVPLVLAVLLVLSLGAQSSQAGSMHRLFVPVLSVNYDPLSEPPVIDDIELTLADDTLIAGQSLPVTVTTTGMDGLPAYNQHLQVVVEVNGRSRDPGGGPATNQIALTDHQDGTYTGVYSDTTGTGQFQAVTIVIYPALGGKWRQVASQTFSVQPGMVETLQMTQLNLRQSRIVLRDMYDNPIPVAALTESEVMCMTGDPSLFNVVVEPDPQNPDWFLQATLVGQTYEHAMLTCTHSASGAAGTVDLAYPPLQIFTIDPDYWPNVGFPAESFFDVSFEVPPPPPSLAPIGWGQLTGAAIVDVSTGVSLEGCVSTDPGLFYVECMPSFIDPDHVRIDFFAEVLGGGGIMTETIPISMTFQAPDVDPSLVVPIHSSIQIVEVNLIDPLLAPIPTNTGAFLPFWFWNWYFKPTKTLNMHVYVVEGSATQQQIETDVANAENGFNLNAFTCACPFFIDFKLTVTTIPAADWQEIDEDGDGLDRWDWNGDGDYDDWWENDDLQNAKDKGYFDSSPNTENVYYVPGILGGAMGSTYAPNGQVAVNNGADSDDLTLFHEKVHEMDLRDDGDFDVDDSPDDAGNAQGARNPGNIMNYDNTGPWLTPAQCAHLDP